MILLVTPHRAPWPARSAASVNATWISSVSCRADRCLVSAIRPARASATSQSPAWLAQARRVTAASVHAAT